MTVLQTTARWLLDKEIWISVTLAAISLAWAPLLPVALLGMLAFWPLRRLDHGRFTERTPADWSVVLMGGMAALGVWLAGGRDPTRVQAMRLLLGILLFYSVRNSVSGRRRNQNLVLAFVLGAIFLAFFSLIGVQWAEDKMLALPAWLHPRFQALVLDAANPNVIAGYLALLLPFPLAVLLFWSKGGGQRGYSPALGIFSIAAVAVVSAILFLTQSRGAWLAALAAILVLVSLRWRHGWISIPIVGTIAIITAGLIGWETVLGSLSTDRNLASAGDRLELWQRAVLIIRDFPFTGIGMGNFGEVVELFYPYRFAPDGATIHAHNLALQIGVDLGLPGLAGWLSLLLGLGAASVAVYRHGVAQRNRWVAGSAAAYLGSLTVYAVHGMVDAVTWGSVRPAPLVWVVWGGLAALASIPLNRAIDALSDGSTIGVEETTPIEA